MDTGVLCLWLGFLDLVIDADHLFWITDLCGLPISTAWLNFVPQQLLGDDSLNWAHSTPTSAEKLTLPDNPFSYFYYAFAPAWKEVGLQLNLLQNRDLKKINLRESCTLCGVKTGRLHGSFAVAQDHEMKSKLVAIKEIGGRNVTKKELFMRPLGGTVS